MIKNDYVVGDRVKRIFCVNPNNYNIIPGMVGTVYKVNGDSALVYWDNFPSDHAACCEGNDFPRLEYLGNNSNDAGVSDLQRGCYTGSAPVAPAGKPSNPKDRAATHRLDLSLFPETARLFGAVAMTEGDSKYGGYNYRVSGVNVSTYKAALDRHMGKYYDRGEWADERTGVPHLANALACIAVLIDGHVKNNIHDDRPPRIQADLYTWAEALSKSLHEMFPNGPDRCTQLKDGNTDGGVPDWLTPKS